SASFFQTSSFILFVIFAERCNNTGTEVRTPAEVNKKFRNMKSAVKEKIAAEKKSVKETGGGLPLREVSEIENMCDGKQFFLDQ
ncbi:MAG: hypothetical protein AAGK05_10710, partial [Pseudomonadota bacterium]